MKTVISIALVAFGLLLTGRPGMALDAKDSLFGQLSPGDPAARKVLESLCEDTSALLDHLLDAAAWKKPEKSGSVDRWNRALNAHIDLWNEKTSVARKGSHGARTAELGGARSETMKGAVKSWPPDWRAWGDAQYKFFVALSRSDFIEWRHGVNVKIHELDVGLEQDPGKFEEVRNQLKWVVDEIRDSRQKAENASSLAEIEKELRRFTRIWTLTSNLERTIKSRKKYVEKFFADESQKPSKVKERSAKAKAFFQKMEAEKMLDPMCKRAAMAFAVQALRASEDYEKKYDEVRKLNKPILEETLFDDLDGFKGEGFALVKVVERYESWLHDRQDALR